MLSVSHYRVLACEALKVPRVSLKTIKKIFQMSTCAWATFRTAFQCTSPCGL